MRTGMTYPQWYQIDDGHGLDQAQQRMRPIAGYCADSGIKTPIPVQRVVLPGVIEGTTATMHQLRISSLFL
jgi:hypothetical protein